MIKSQIDSRDREWSPSTKTWIFAPPIGSTTALRLLRIFYPGFEITNNQAAPPPPPFTAQPEVDPDCARLFVLPNAPRVVVDAAYRALAREYHPDRLPEGERDVGHERMTMLNVSYERIRQRVAS